MDKIKQTANKIKKAEKAKIPLQNRALKIKKFQLQMNQIYRHLIVFKLYVTYYQHFPIKNLSRGFVREAVLATCTEYNFCSST